MKLYFKFSELILKNEMMEVLIWMLSDLLSAAFYADAARHVNRLTLAFALHFPAFERSRSTRSLASFLRSVFLRASYASLLPHLRK